MRSEIASHRWATEYASKVSISSAVRYMPFPFVRGRETHSTATSPQTTLCGHHIARPILTRHFHALLGDK